MNIYELLGYDKIRHVNPTASSHQRKQSLVGKLQNLGYVSIGSGNFATVFTHPQKPYVMKLFHRDPCYLAFVNIARQHRDNPHFPKFIGKPIALPTDKEMFGIRMEKLDKAPDSVTSQLYTMSTALRGVQDDEDGAEIDYSLRRALNIIRSTDTKCIEDFGINNIMMRGTTIVITDPYFTRWATEDYHPKVNHLTAPNRYLR